MIRAAIDRIEGDWIIIIPEDGPMFQVPVSLFPGLLEKDVVSISIEKDETREREGNEEIESIRNRLNRVSLS